jgi:Fe2+ transport system protein FeoA
VGANKDFIASLLRKGNQAVIKSVKSSASTFGLKPGDKVQMQGRSADGKVWTLVTSDGRQVDLNHDQADAIIVRLVD